MRKNAILAAAVAAFLTSGAALAQNNDHRGERGDRYQQQQSQRGDQHRGDNDRYDGRDGNRYSRDRNDGYRGDRGDGHRGDRGDRRGDYRDHREHRGYGSHNGYYYGRGAGPRYDMHRGGYVAREYRGSRYVVSDWRRHRGLYAPQRGYHWVQAGNDYLLVAIASGLIAQVLLN